MAKKISCGVIVTDGEKILLGHITHKTTWDIPKGGIDDGESEVDCALRELYEETGIILHKSNLQPLGKFEYKKSKDLVLFMAKTSLPDPSTLKCVSMFSLYGNKFPELDGFTTVSYQEAYTMVNPDLRRILMQILGG